jgi:predicted esterase
VSDASERVIPQRTFSYYDLYVPEGREHSRPMPLLVAAHGYGGDKASMLRAVRRINERDFAVASLQAIHQHIDRSQDGPRALGYGFGWLTNFKPAESIALHHHAVDAIVDDLVAEGVADPRRVFLIGFSQACALNFRYAFTRPERVRGVVAICGGIPGDWSEEGKYRAGEFDVLYVAARQDEFYAPERIERFAEALRSRARSVELQFYDVGHVVPREAREPIDVWLRERAGVAP